jgi:hypothetical protein
MTEEWRDIPGFSYYQASSLGRIRSISRTTTERDSYGGSRKVSHKGKILKPCRNRKTGYWQLGVRVRQKQKMKRVHNLVALAFHGNCPPNQEVRHLDGIKKNNKPSNLKYGTRKRNIQDAIEHGTLYRPNTKGAMNGKARLTEADVEFIRRKYKFRDKKFGQAALGNRFNVDRTTISDVINGRTWQ